MKEVIGSNGTALVIIVYLLEEDWYEGSGTLGCQQLPSSGDEWGRDG